MMIFALPGSALVMTWHPHRAPALKVGSGLLGAFSHHGTNLDIISKD